MKVQLEVTRPRWFTLGTRYRKLKAAGVALGATLVVAVPAAWANHDFSDVPTAHQFHSQISAIKGAGITTGCGVGLYCPDDLVRRDAMAAFMHRGFGRVAQGEWFIGVPTVETAATVTSTITTGVAAGSSGNGFLKTDASVQIYSDCDSLYRVLLYLQGYGYMGSDGAYQTVYTGEFAALHLTGAAPAGTGAKTVEVRIFGGCGAAESVGDVTTTYLPFGSTGTTTLAVDGATVGNKGRFGPADK